ncbi:hypothetical protein Aca07nite_74710 [Actinoplanes capillaceus]|uniref:Uncharacterized protein n=1 Tax=Actinoplanes campanulatus TaxID=113559 RepID=A0ABQ3WV79_9ACTN|nr:hypothetical protein [Actinoplanes capillaceus]GID50196.1 hypothetical protein Aca07nite_74710 [Actinoplanes capillaceus]
MTASGGDGGKWRSLLRPDFGLADVISDTIARASHVHEDCIRELRGAESLLLFSDYGGAHKEAKFEVLSFLVTTVPGVREFDTERRRLRAGGLGTERRMAYKSLNDKVRMRNLGAFGSAANLLPGLLVNFAIDKRSIDRVGEGYQSDTTVGRLGPWAQRSFSKLTRVGNMAGILFEGVRREGQNLIWITDEDEIAPNVHKHTESTKILVHYLSCYLSGNMGHFRFGTTASDTGDLLIEDLAAIPDLAAGCLGEILSMIAPHPASSSIARLFVPANTNLAAKVIEIATWLGSSSGVLRKINIVIDEGGDGCAVRDFTVVTNFEEL